MLRTEILYEIKKHSIFGPHTKRLINNYIRATKTTNFSYDCMSYFPNKHEVFLYFYNNNGLFRKIVNKKESQTIYFLSHTCELYEFINNFINVEDLHNNPTSWKHYIVDCIHRGYRLEYRFYDWFRPHIYNLFELELSVIINVDANNYVVCLEELQKHENVDRLIKLYIDSNLSNRYCDFNCLLNTLPDDKKDFWNNYIFLQRVRCKVV